jgi:hypothetical protein
MKFENVIQKGLFRQAVLAALLPGRKYDVISQMAAVQEKAMCVLCFFETKSVIKRQHGYRTQ